MSPPRAARREDAAVSDSAKIASHDLCAALRLAHPDGEYVTLFEVRETVGGSSGSRADALVLSLWPSRGFELTGFEFKCNRGDWLSELRNPEKADRIARYCDRWCLFAAPGVVKEGELPSGWGLWELSTDGSIKRRVQAAAREPEPMPRSFLASLMRARARLDSDDLPALYAQYRRDWEKSLIGRPVPQAAATASADTTQAEQVRAALQKLEEIRQATGVDLRTYTPSRQWIERMRLAGSTQLEQKLRVLRDVMFDHELRKQLEIALRPEPPAQD